MTVLSLRRKIRKEKEDKERKKKNNQGQYREVILSVSFSRSIQNVYFMPSSSSVAKTNKLFTENREYLSSAYKCYSHAYTCARKRMNYSFLNGFVCSLSSTSSLAFLSFCFFFLFFFSCIFNLFLFSCCFDSCICQFHISFDSVVCFSSGQKMPHLQSLYDLSGTVIFGMST